MPGKAYSEVDVASDRDRIDLEYRNRGYESVAVDPRVMLADANTRANVLFTISEGPQVIVDHVIIIGNKRTSTSTIQRELTLRPGEPLGYAARIESQQRLSALGLFRRVNITELTHESESRRDVLVQVEEAPPTTISYGGGVEGQTILRPTGPGGQAEERFELAPRGSFEVTRSNLWGKNRSIDLFTRASLRSRDVLVERSSVSAPAASTTTSSSYGINEYRVLGTYREPKVFNTRADVLVTAILDQAKRSSFNFRTREVRGEAGLHVTPRVSVAGRYSFQHTTLFDINFAPDDPVVPLIDRLFPQVRLSKFSNSLIRDNRDDLLDPSRGAFLALNSDVAARAVGSEVGFVKTFAQAFEYFRLPVRRRIILATGERVGVAHGFPRVVETVDADGIVTSQTVRDLPASERFFAGGDTTVRGFSLDRLGTAADDQLDRISDRRQWRNRAERRAAHRRGQGIRGRHVRRRRQHLSERDRPEHHRPAARRRLRRALQVADWSGPCRARFQPRAARARARRPRAPDRPAHLAGPGLLVDAMFTGTDSATETQRHRARKFANKSSVSLRLCGSSSS